MKRIDRHEVIRAIQRHLQLRKEERRLPLIVLKEQLSSVVGYDFDALRPILLDLYQEGLLISGHTLNSTYFTLPEYV